MKYLESKDFIKIQKAAKTEAKKELQENLKNQKKEELLSKYGAVSRENTLKRTA
jgi:hypothetical protein